VFGITADDQAELYLSTTENWLHKSKIASIPKNSRVTTYPYVYDQFSSQLSDSITLVEGGRYYIEVLQKNQDGANFWAVRVDVPAAVDTYGNTIADATTYNSIPPQFMARSSQGPGDLWRPDNEIVLYHNQDAGTPPLPDVAVLSPPVTAGNQYPYIYGLTMPKGSACKHCALAWSYAGQQYSCADIVIFSHDEDILVTFTFQLPDSSTSPMLPDSFKTRFFNIFTSANGFVEGQTVFFNLPDAFTVHGDTYKASVSIGNSLTYTASDLTAMIAATSETDLTAAFVHEVVNVDYQAAGAPFTASPSVMGTTVLAAGAAMYQLL